MTPALKVATAALLAELKSQNALDPTVNDPPLGAQLVFVDGCVNLERVTRAVLGAIQTPSVEVANAMVSEVQKAAALFVQRERAGSSTSMNGALDYVEFAAWRAGIEAILKDPS